MLSKEKGKRIYQYQPDYVVFDLETTGTFPQRDAVVEISAVKVVNGVVVDEFSTLVNPECHIPREASDINGITDRMVAQSPCFQVALKDFLTFAGDSLLVGHNIHSFDMKFLYRFSEQYWGLYPDNDYLDTLSLSHQALPELPHHTLVDLTLYYGLSARGAHRALNDCRMNQQVFELMKDEPALKCQLSRSCPRCGAPLLRKKGKFGPFLGCSSYPQCRYTEKISE